MQLLGTVIAGCPGLRWTSKTSGMGSGALCGPGKASPSELLLEVSSACTSKPGDLGWPAAVAREVQAVPIAADHRSQQTIRSSLTTSTVLN